MNIITKFEIDTNDVITALTFLEKPIPDESKIQQILDSLDIEEIEDVGSTGQGFEDKVELAIQNIMHQIIQNNLIDGLSDDT